VAVVLRGVDDRRIVYGPKVEQVGNIEPSPIIARIRGPRPRSHLVVVDDIHQHVDPGEAFEDFATRHIYLEDVAFS
jgi:hypothetical protein